MATTNETGVIPVVDVNDVIDVSDETLPKKKASRRQSTGSQKKRIVWAKIEGTKSVNGTNQKSYPLLLDDNYQDIYLVRVLLTLTPFKAGYGSSTKEWEAAAASLSTQQDPSGKLVFPDGIPTRAMRSRFEDLMKWVKKCDGNVPFRSGEDDEAEPNEMQSGLEDIYEDWTSFEDSKQVASNINAAQQKLEKEQAEQIRKASVGEMSRTELRNTLNATALTTPVATSKYKSGTSASSSVSAPSSGGGTPSTELDQIKFQLLSRLQGNDAFQSTEERGQRKKQKFDLQKQRADQEQQRIDLEKQRVANEQQRVANEHEQRTQQMKMNELMMKFIVDSQKKNGED